MKYSAIAGALSLCLVAAAAHAQTAQTEANKALAIRFYNAACPGDIATLQALGRPDYIQHTQPSRPTSGPDQRINERRRAAGVSADPTPPSSSALRPKASSSGCCAKCLHRRRQGTRQRRHLPRAGRQKSPNTGTIRRPSPAGRAAEKQQRPLLTTAATKEKRDARRTKLPPGATARQFATCAQAWARTGNRLRGTGTRKNFIIRRDIARFK